MTTTPKLINQGTFGCIYRPNISCKNSITTTNNTSNTSKKLFVSKISTVSSFDDSILENMENMEKNNIEETKIPEFMKETIIGKVIQKIPNYQMFYSPIIETCNIDVNKISEKEYEKCKIFNKQTPNNTDVVFIASKVKFIQGVFMSKYFKTIKRKKLLFKKIIDSFFHLTRGIFYLQNNGNDNAIVHYDIKDNNIIFDKKKGIPIIIDFGLSFKKSVLLNPAKLKNVFYVYYDKYPAWCIDIVLLSYITQNILSNNINIYNKFVQKQDILQLQDVCKNFVDNFVIFKETNLFTKQEIDEFKNGLLNWVSLCEGKKWKDCITNLTQHWASWDIYSICVMYVFYFVNLQIEFVDVPPFFLKLLKETILFCPSHTPINTRTRINASYIKTTFLH